MRKIGFDQMRREEFTVYLKILKSSIRHVPRKKQGLGHVLKTAAADPADVILTVLYQCFSKNSAAENCFYLFLLISINFLHILFGQ